MYTLYSMSGSCSTAIHILLNSLNAPVNIIFSKDVDNYHELNPTGQVPALKTDHGLLTEGAAISLYLLDQHKAHSNCDVLDFNKWLMFNYATLHPAYSKMFTTQFGMEEGTQKQQFLSLLAEKVSELWKIVDVRLAENDFMAGDQVSILDYLITIYAGWGNVFPQVNIPLGENVLRVIKHVMTLPEFKIAIQKEDMQFAIPDGA
jgi:glutathione S-transferase